jgi:hypothetical protein
MHYKGGGAADTTMPHKLAPVPAADGHSHAEPPSDTDDLEAFSQAISLQAAARAARYAIRPGSIGKGFGRGESYTMGARVSLGRAFNLMLAFALGVAVYAGVMYVILGTQLHSPLPTPPLPRPGATLAAR